jgi:cytochrome c oxidase assembly protein subunit 11
MFIKLAVVVGVMFAFGYGMVPMYREICAALGINVLSVAERQGLVSVPASGSKDGHGNAINTQIDASRVITVEFDANSFGPWQFKPEKRFVEVHPGEMSTVMYEFTNVQNRTMAAQAIPSYAPKQAMPYFNKLECFCFAQYTLQAGESKRWPVVFIIDPKLPKDVKTITLSYTFFEVGGRIPAEPQATALPNGTPVASPAVAIGGPKS